MTKDPARRQAHKLRMAERRVAYKYRQARGREFVLTDGEDGWTLLPRRVRATYEGLAADQARIAERNKRRQNDQEPKSRANR